MGSHRDSSSDVPTEQSTSYFNTSYFPESYFTEQLLEDNYDTTSDAFDESVTASFMQSYNNLKATTATRNTSNPSQGLILGSTTTQYQPYYPTNEEVPITAGLGADLVNWKRFTHTGSSITGTRSQTSNQRTSLNSKNGHTPPTICETATIVNGGQTDVDFTDDIDLHEAMKEDFTYLTRFKKQTSIIRNVDNVNQQSGIESYDQIPSLASTASFFPAGEQQSYSIDGMRFNYDADSTVSKSQSQSSIFTGDNRRAAGLARSVTSYTESSIADSVLSDRYRRSQIIPNYPQYLHEDDVATIYSDLSDFNLHAYAQYSTAQQPYNAIENIAQQMAPPPAPVTACFGQSKRRTSYSPSPPATKRRVKKEHICENCHSNFTEKTNLTRHIKSRKCSRGGVEMFYCPVSGCTRSYEGRSDNLKTHMKRVHRKEWQKLNSFQGDWRNKASLGGWLYGTA